MRVNKLLGQLLVLMTPLVVGVNGYANDKVFKPASTPIFSTPQAKPNIHMVLDDSGSMDNSDITLPEHSLGFGQPVCVERINDRDYTTTVEWEAYIKKWRADRKTKGEYDPFETKDHWGRGTYAPWDDSKAVDGLINGLKKPPALLKCKRGTRRQALDYAVTNLLYKYKDKSYLGATFLNQHGKGGPNSQGGSGAIRLELGDYSKYGEQDFDKLINYVSKLVLVDNNAATPFRPAVYETIKMFRGQPVSKQGTRGVRTSQYVGRQHHTYYDYEQLSSPLRYRCQQNHIIMMTDGEPNGDTAYGIAEVDKPKGFERHLSAVDHNSFIVNGVDLSKSAYLGGIGRSIGRIAATTDLRDWARTERDDAGQPWKDKLSTPMPIIMHSVSLQVNPNDEFYTDLTSYSKGKNLGFAQNKGTAEDLLLAFDTIFSSIIRSTSSTLAVNDRMRADVQEGAPSMSNGTVDLSNVGTIRYDTTYNFRQRFGEVRAMVPYIVRYENVPGKKSGTVDKKPITEEVYLWSTNDTIKANQGRYVTYINAEHLGQQLYDLNSQQVKKRFNEILKSVYEDGEEYDASYIQWLTNFEVPVQTNGLRGRLNPMGSITNSDIKILNKDILNINVAEEKMSTSLSKDLKTWLRFKAKHQPKNLIVVGDNDGFINFINAQRGLTGHHKGGERDTAYFPQLLAHRLPEIAKANREATLVMEGKTGVVDAKVHEASIGNVYATIGLTSMGSGGKGVVGYQIYAAPETVVNEWSNDRKSASKDNAEVTPLFEITNEGPEAFRTKGFENLGYTYSGFEFFNRQVDGKGQAVAVFGNGFGVEKSILYFIDAYTGEKLHEIVLNPNGGGASTPALMIQKSNDGQAIDRIYVGDYSGTLYRVDMNGQSFSDSNVIVTALFKAPETVGHYGQSAISVQPMVIKNKANGDYNVYFGTGLAASQTLDRGDNSQVQHNIYNVIDRNQSGFVTSHATVGTMNQSYTFLLPILSIENLRKGSIKYRDVVAIDYTQVVNDLDIDITIPESDTPNRALNGWYIQLNSDGHKGERVIQKPKYDAINDAVIFATWGIHERGDSYNDMGVYDPCLADAAFGKMLAFDAETGGRSSRIGIANKGQTNNAPGGITGDGIVDSPDSNTTTDIEDLEQELQDELIESVGEDNSSYVTTEESVSVYCKGDVSGGSECSVTDKSKPKNKLVPKRISVLDIVSA